MLGQEQYTLFVQERFEEQHKTISNPPKKNTLPLLYKKKNLTKVDHQVAALKEDRSLFGCLYIASQNCDGDLQNFFKHENQPWPPIHSQYGELRSGIKSDLLQCPEELFTSPRESPRVDVSVLDGACIVQMLGTGTSTTFQEYVDTVFMPHIRRKLTAVHRVDIVWDVYKSNSLKSGTRTKRGSWLRRKVILSTIIPGNWQSFLVQGIYWYTHHKLQQLWNLYHFVPNTILYHILKVSGNLESGTWFFRAVYNTTWKHFKK